MKRRQIRYKTFDQLTITDYMVYSKLPEHPFWSNLETKIDFSFADRLCSVLYTGQGQYPYAPSLKLKIHLTQAYENASDRIAEQKIIADLFIKRFLGLPVDFFGFDHSTIGLDRSRMGAAMFRACHLYILAQMKQHGLWGDQSEQWIIDSFFSNVAISKVGSYRLIMKAMVNLLQHLKRNHPALFEFTMNSVALDSLSFRIKHDAAEDEKILAFSKLVAEALGLLQWFQNEDMVIEMEKWSNEKARQQCVQHQALLERVIKENTYLLPEYEDSSSHSGSSGTDHSAEYDESSEIADSSVAVPSDRQEKPKYGKIPFKKRPTDRIYNLTDPDVTVSVKRGVKYVGYKIQNLVTTSDVILSVRAVPALEHDRDAMYGMVKEIQDFFHVTPNGILGDTAYGHGPQRVKLASLNIPVIAPVPKSDNPTNLYSNDQFTYDAKSDTYTCPNQLHSIRKYHNPQLNGTQYYFGKQCNSCSLNKECTTSKTTGRSIFRTDFHEIYEKADAFNGSIEGKVIYQKRDQVERKNQEVKNDCGLGRLLTRSQETAEIKGILAGIVVNLKLTVRRLVNPKPGFIRRPKLC